MSNLPAPLRRTARAGIVGAVALGSTAAAVLPSMASAAKSQTCSGTMKKPGALAGTYSHGVTVKGVCAVKRGAARVSGRLTLQPGAVLLAAFGSNHRTHHGGSSLTVLGDVALGHGSVLVLGCNPKSSPCMDDNPKQPKLSSHGRITGNLIANRALGVIIHSSSIGHDVRQNGGGGGITCRPVGAFKAQGSPAFSAYEDSTIRGDLKISGIRSCWLGIVRTHVGGTVDLKHNQLADADAIEVLSNRIGKNLVCRGNSRLWDSTETAENSLYPRAPQPNRVGGKRVGQCVLANPTIEGGQPGPGAF